MSAFVPPIDDQDQDSSASYSDNLILLQVHLVTRPARTLNAVWIIFFSTDWKRRGIAFASTLSQSCLCRDTHA